MLENREEGAASGSEASERASLYSLLSTVFGREPTAQLIDALGRQEVKDALAGLDVHIDFPAFTQADIARLGREYVYLFIGPGPHLPPFESVQRGSKDASGKKQLGQMLGRPAIEVEQIYERQGLEIGRELRDQPDHLAAELAFMAHLCRREDEDPREASRWRHEQTAFLREHLGRWAPDFCRTVAGATDEPYFKEFAELTAGFIETELASLSNISP